MITRAIALLGVVMSVAWAACTANAATCVPAGRPRIAEVFYDAIGDDSGQEFVELFHTGATPASLAGVRLEVGDGSGPGRWTLRWTGTARDSIPAGDRFVIGGALVTPTPSVTVTLDLQNGPDAVRLVWPDGTTEVVGYGTHEFAEYACGTPAPDVASGSSLARIPDGADFGNNALDFRAATPSPGRANQPTRDAALLPGSLALEPEQPDPGQRVRLGAAVTNRGASKLTAGEVVLVGHELEPDREVERFAVPLERSLASGDTADVVVEFAAGLAGKRTLVVAATLTGDEAPENDADSLRVRVGPGPLVLSEIQFHPSHGEGEWIETRNRSSAALDPSAFRLGDRSGARGTPADGVGLVPPESLVVFVEDKAALLAHFPSLDASRVWQVRPWSALNNSDDSTHVADVVQLRESDGTLVHRVPYSATGVPAGVPIEDRDGWWPSRAEDGTPLSPPRVPPKLAGRFEVTPHRITPSTTPLRFAWSLPWSTAFVAIELYDLAGRRLGIALPESRAPGQGERTWTMDPPTPGLYLLVLRARATSGGETLTSVQPFRVAGAS
jgi:hypothetical protein